MTGIEAPNLQPPTAAQILDLWTVHEKAVKHALGSVPPAALEFDSDTIVRDLGLMYMGILLAFRLGIGDAFVLSIDMAKYVVEQYGQHGAGGHA